MTPETFTLDHIVSSLKAFLSYGEDTFNPSESSLMLTSCATCGNTVVRGDSCTKCSTKASHPLGHGGYFSGTGYAARAMRYLLDQLPTLWRDAELARRIASIANRYGWNGVENSKILDVFIESELLRLADDHKALQQIMQVLGPHVPDVDYTDKGNLAGLTYEIEEALRILRARGITYQSGRRRGDVK